MAPFYFSILIVLGLVVGDNSRPLTKSELFNCVHRNVTPCLPRIPPATRSRIADLLPQLSIDGGLEEHLPYACYLLPAHLPLYSECVPCNSPKNPSTDCSEDARRYRGEKWADVCVLYCDLHKHSTSTHSRQTRSSSSRPNQHTSSGNRVASAGSPSADSSTDSPDVKTEKQQAAGDVKPHGSQADSGPGFPLAALIQVGVIMAILVAAVFLFCYIAVRCARGKTPSPAPLPRPSAGNSAQSSPNDSTYASGVTYLSDSTHQSHLLLGDRKSETETERQDRATVTIAIGN